MIFKKKNIFIFVLIILIPGLLLVDKKINYNINLEIDKEIASNVYVVSNQDNVSFIDLKYQKDIDNLIYNKKNNKVYKVDNPLFILNPYGTNITGLYVYFYTFTKYKVEYTISVNDSDIPDFTNTLSSDLTRNHEGQIIGLIQDMENTLSLKLINSDNEIVCEYHYKINIPNYNTNTIKKINSTVVDNNKLSDGLYIPINVLNGSTYLPLSFYDSSGVLRSEFTKDTGNNTYRIIFVYDNLFYAIDSNRYVLVNRLGKIQNIYNVELESNHDYIYSEYNNSIIYIAGTSYIKKLDLDSGVDVVLFELDKLMKNYYETALNYYRKKNNDIDVSSFNWAHPNSIEIVNEKDIIISLRETSSIIYVSNVYTNPSIKYIIAPEKIYEGTEYEKYLLKQDGNFSVHAGQHTVILKNDNSLDDGQYYLYMFNNNYAKSDTVPNSSWVTTIKGVGTKNKSAKNSMYYKYLVDEKNKTFTLIDNFDILYSNTKSGVQIYNDGNYIISSGENSVIQEYDVNKKLLLELKFEDYNDIYRAYKVDMKDFWFGNSYSYTKNKEVVDDIDNNSNNIKEENNSDFYYSKKSNSILGVNSSNSNSNESDIIYYNNIYFTMYDYHTDTLIIPSNINGVNIKKIAGINYLNVKKIIVSEGIEEIGDYAFLGCNNLEEIILPKSLKKIGRYSFVLCNKIKKIDIPENVEFIDSECFKGWNKNQVINVNKNWGNYSSNWDANSQAKINKGVK